MNTQETAENTYGALEPVSRLKAHDVLPSTTDPTGRFVGYRHGTTVHILDVAPDAPVNVAVHKHACGGYRTSAVHPDGRQLAVRDTVGQRLTMQDANGKVRQAVATETTLTDWVGNPLAPKTPPPQWGYGDETVSFSADGAHILLATHLPNGKACVQLYDTATLEVVDTLTDLRLYSYYATNGEVEFEPMANWSESWLSKEPLEPGLLLGVRNAGDSALGAFGIFAQDGRVQQLDPAKLSAAVFKVDNYCLTAVRLLPSGLLVVDRDHHLGRVAWPPEADEPKRLAHRQMTAHLRNDDWEIALPWAEPGARELEESEALSVTDDHVLLNIDDSESCETQAVVAFEPLTLEPLGLVKRPKSRLSFGEIEHLGGDLFAGSGKQTTQLWRLRR